MTFPLHIQNRLNLGGDIAAKVKATRSDYSAWVYIEPLTETTFQQARARWMLKGQYHAFDRFIKGYYIRYIELSEWHLAWDWDLDHALQQRPTIDYQMCVRDEEALEQVVSWWCHDFSLLGLPTDYPEPPRTY